MFEIDKVAFGAFIAEQRKAKGYTQKELAEKLFISDKAISKWERALSLPDITLLVPLADALDVTVTELLEGRKLDNGGMNKDEVEAIVKKAINFSEEIPGKKLEKRSIAVFGGCVILSILELAFGIWVLPRLGFASLFKGAAQVMIIELLSFIFGLYAWFIMKDRLPAYYDENRINVYSDGFFRMNMPGVNFNNRNWPHIVKALQIWSVISLITAPLVGIILTVLPIDYWVAFGIQYGLLLVYLVGLFAPIYVVGKKHG